MMAAHDADPRRCWGKRRRSAASSRAVALGALLSLASVAEVLPQRLAGETPRRRDSDFCQGIQFPRHIIVLPQKKLLWCPNAKAGTSSMYRGLARAFNDTDIFRERCFGPWWCPSLALRHIGDYSAEEREELCTDKDTLSIIVVRNPFDRVYSGYLSKIKPVCEAHMCGIARDVRLANGLPEDAPTVEFHHFVRYLAQLPLEKMDLHWLPASVRCGEYGFRYDRVVHIEDDYTGIMKEVFAQVGLDPDAFPEKHFNAHFEGSNYSIIRNRKEHYHCPACENPTELIETVSRIYADDLRLYGYSFDH